MGRRGTAPWLLLAALERLIALLVYYRLQARERSIGASMLAHGRRNAETLR